MKLKLIRTHLDRDAFALRIVKAHVAVVLPDQVPDVDQFVGMKRWQAAVALDKPDTKAMTVCKGGDGTVCDYQNVPIKGYLSTFKNVTESDRQGDYVVKGAFTETLARFMQNPVMLRDHMNSVNCLVGTFTKCVEDANGLYVEGMLSNAPDNINCRFKVAEGMLKTLSMGGLFHYKEDGRGIFKVDLWEGSLTPIPANPDARFNVRSLTDSEKHFVKTMHLWPSYYHFLESIREPNRAEVAA